MSARLRFAILAISLFGGACATSEEQQELPPPKRPPDANTFIDTSYDSTMTETEVTDSISDSTAGETETCTPLTTENRACGKCGTQTRTCSSGGVWNEWSVCTGEKSFSSCSIGDVRVNDCGKCGTQKDICDPVSCEWSAGACLGEPVGACTKGETDTSTASCPTAGEVRTRTCTDKCVWGAYGDCTLPKGWIKMSAVPTGFDGRIHHSAVWTGTDMIVWGGYGTYVSPNYGRRNGASYNLASDTWKNIALPPSTVVARYNHTAVWSGSKMIVWGGNDYSTGYRNDGAIYDPSTDTWTTAAATTLAARYFHAAVWSTTTNEMIVWGGYGSLCAGTYCGDGAAFDPATGTWTTLPAAPIAGRWKHTMVWTGTELIVWGGQGAAGYLRDGARYDPKTKIWTKFADPPAELEGRIDFASVWNGKELLVWGGYGTYLSPSYGKSDGARYLPGGSWTRFTVPMDDIFATGTVATRHAIPAWYGNGKLYLWSGANGNSSSGAALTGGVSYDPATDKWTTLDVMSAPTARARATVVWTGKEAILFGGGSTASGSTYYADGAVYRP
jgi:N-acetylneuraminic acid mutarotase